MPHLRLRPLLILLRYFDIFIIMLLRHFMPPLITLFDISHAIMLSLFLYITPYLFSLYYHWLISFITAPYTLLSFSPYVYAISPFTFSAYFRWLLSLFSFHYFHLAISLLFPYTPFHYLPLFMITLSSTLHYASFIDYAVISTFHFTTCCLLLYFITLSFTLLFSLLFPFITHWLSLHYWHFITLIYAI